MSVLSSLTDALDQLFGFAPTHDAVSEVPLDWGSLANENYAMNGNSASGIQNWDSSSLPFDVPDNPFDLNTSAINSIIQKKSPAFQVIDIDPWAVAAGTTNPSTQGSALPSNQVPIQKIIDKIGNDFDSSSSVPNTVFSGGWFTVAIPTPGTFLKMEFLPAPVGGYNTNTGAGNDINNLGLNNGNTDKTGPFQTNANSLRTDYSADIQHSAFGLNQANNFALLAYKHIIFIQFDDNNGPLQILKPGMVFKTAFQTVYVTFKRWCPRFSLTLGYNNEIIDPFEHRAMNANPAFGPGYGMWDAPNRHCTTFCFGTNDQDPTNGTVLTLAAGTTIIKTLFQNNLNGAQNATGGLIIGWITNLDFGFVSRAVTSTTQIQASIIVQRGGASGDTTTKLICSFPLVGAYSVNGVGGQTCNKTYSTPRRFILKPNDKLQLVLRNSNSTGDDMMFAIEGYMYGRSDNNKMTGTFPGYVSDVIYQNPFPLDYVEGQL